MLAKAKEYQERARGCVRMAEQADSEETRDRLLELALIEIEEEGYDQD
jgi:hypothetical protein